MRTILLTGFEPFGSHALNPSELVGRRVGGRTIGNHRVVGSTLSCEFGKSLSQLKALLEQHKPSLVVCLGLAENRKEITPEHVAINVDDARIPDNGGRQP